MQLVVKIPINNGPCIPVNYKCDDAFVREFDDAATKALAKGKDTLTFANQVWRLTDCGTTGVDGKWTSELEVFTVDEWFKKFA